uniref:Pre-rRNA-processing protein TSR2 homolog n=1 Tax=Craspedostauros australis TaxID=1486917 RepID=A0A7R9WRC4_9STRA|mmetsp:Transcript_17119/g.47420  ORF Transcript_17119/g.47420 Transcript_17119/m.47420 type:complete len:219 (+) Transcript_17119:121-777(+)
MATIDDFKAGVTACLRSWSAFRTAVENGWGGGTNPSFSKAEELRNSILQIMNGQKCPIPNFDVYDLSDNLAIYMEEEFSVTLEDKSEEQVAATIFQIYEQCYNGDASLARSLVTQAEQAIATTSQFPTHVQKTEHDEDDDDEDMVDSATGQAVAPINVSLDLDMAAYASAPLFGEPKAAKTPANEKPLRQLGEAAPVAAPVEMDDDGFAPVKPKGRRR